MMLYLVGVVGSLSSSPSCTHQPDILYSLTPRGFFLLLEDHCSALCRISPDCVFYVWHQKSRQCTLDNSHPIGALPCKDCVTGGRLDKSGVVGMLALSSMKVVQINKGNPKVCRKMCEGDVECKRWVWAEKLWESVRSTCILDYRDSEGLEKMQLNDKDITVGSCNNAEKDVGDEEKVKKVVRKPNTTSRPKPRTTTKPRRKISKNKTPVKHSTKSSAEMTEPTTKMSTTPEHTDHRTTMKQVSEKRVSTRKPVQRRTTPKRTISRKTTKRRTTTNTSTVAMKETATAASSTPISVHTAPTRRTTKRKQLATKGPKKKHALSEEVSVVLLQENTTWEEISPGDRELEPDTTAEPEPEPQDKTGDEDAQ